MKLYDNEPKHKSIFKIYAIYFICMVSFCGIRLASAFGFGVDGVVGDVIFSIMVQIVILFVLPLLLFCFWFKSKPKRLFVDCNFEKTNIKVILISLAIGVLCFIINIAVSSLFNGILSFTGYRSPFSSREKDFSNLNFILDLITVCVLPAFCEEFIHRGVLLQGIKHAGFKKAIVISSLLFGLIHFNINQFFYAFVVGLIMGFVSVVSKNIIPAMIIHFTNNAISIYINYATARKWFLGGFFEWLQELIFSSNVIWVFIVSAVVMLIVIVLLCLLVYVLYRQSILRKVHKAINKVYKIKGSLISNKPIIVEEDRVIRELLENNTLLNLNYEEMKSPIDIVMPKEKTRYIVTLKDRIFLWGAITLSGLITFFTYIWGLF